MIVRPINARHTDIVACMDRGILRSVFVDGL